MIGAGAGSLYLADTDEEAIRRYRPYYDAYHSTAAAQHNQSPFTSLEDNIRNGPVLIGSAESVLEKIRNYHTAFGHQVLSISVDGLGEQEQLEQLHRFSENIIPVLRQEIPSTIWQHGPNLDDGSRSIIPVKNDAPPISPIFQL